MIEDFSSNKIPSTAVKGFCIGKRYLVYVPLELLKLTIYLGDEWYVRESYSQD